MRRSHRSMAVLGLAALMLAGCQYNFRVRAERQGDHYLLTAPNPAGRFAPHSCVGRLTILQGEQIVWEIGNKTRGWPHEGRDCVRTDFPIVYGVAPDGFETIVPARPLEPGGEYLITGSGISGYHGRFTIRADLTVDNLKRNQGN